MIEPLVRETFHRPPIRVALMGLGRAAFADHIPVFAAHPALFKVVAACDLLKERRDRLQQLFPDCRMFRQFDDMLLERDLDLVDIATPSIDHPRQVVQALDKNRWVLVETPLALNTEDAQLIQGTARLHQNRLIVFQRGMFAPDYLLALAAMQDKRLGEIHAIEIRREDYVRRDDWQAIKRLGGGAAYYEMTDLFMQVLKLLPVMPIQLWSDLKRVASVGDAEDYVHVCLRTRELISAEVTYSGGVLPGDRGPSFTIRGERGSFKVQPGAKTGTLHVIDPDFKFPRRRSSVRTPPLEDLHEALPVTDIPVTLPPGSLSGTSAFWRHVYDSVRTAAPFPLTLEQSMEAVKFAHLIKKASPYATGK